MSFGEKFLNTLGFETAKQKKVKDLETRIERTEGVIKNMGGIQERDLVGEIGEIPSDQGLLKKHQETLVRLREELAKLKASN